MNMSPPIHFLLDESPQEWNAWRQANHQPICLDAIDLSKRVLPGLNLEKSSLQRINGNDTQLDEASCEAADFTGSSLVNTSFKQAHCSSIILDNCDLSHADFREADLQSASLKGAVLYKADLRGANLSGVNFEGADLYKANLDNTTLCAASFTNTRLLECSLRNTTGLWGKAKAIAPDESQESIRTQARFAIYHTSYDFFTWEQLRFIGSLSAFSLSYLSILALTLYTLCAETANNIVRAVSTHVGMVSEPFPLPNPLGYQLIALVLIAIGATIFKFACPDLVQENSENRWCSELKNSVLEYRAASHSRPLLRAMCTVLFTSGGIYSLFYLAKKVLRAISYYF